MFILQSLLSLIAGSTVLASVFPSTGGLSRQDDDFNFVKRGATDSAPVLSPRRQSSSKKPMTNAERFARGLPPSKPSRLYDSPTRRQSLPSGTPSVTGTIQVSEISTGDIVGVVGDYDTTDNGIFTVIPESEAAQALTVVASLSDSPTGNIITKNGFSDYPYLGAVQGYYSPSADLSASDGNYDFLCGIAVSTGPNSGPVSGVSNSFGYSFGGEPPAPNGQTSIWSVNPTTLSITAHFVDTDGSTPPTTIMYNPGSGEIAFTGNVADFIQDYGDTYVAVTFTLVPAV